MAIPCANRLKALGATSLELVSINAGYDVSPGNVQAAMNLLIAAIDAPGLAGILGAWRNGYGPFGYGLPGVALPFGTRVPVLTGDPADDTFGISAGTGLHLTPLSPGDATGSTEGLVRLAGDLGGSAVSPTVPGLAAKVGTSDARLSNARAPTVHASTHGPAGTDPLPIDAGPTVGSVRTLGQGAQQAMAGNDIRVTSEALNVQAPPYNVPNDGTDGTTGLLAAVAAMPASGGIIDLRDGDFSCSAQLNFDGTKSITIRGHGGYGAGALATTRLMYTGAGASFLSAKSSQGFKLDDLMVEYNNSLFTGVLVDLSRGSGLDTAGPVIDHCFLGGAGIRTAALLVLLTKANGAVLRKSMLTNAGDAIRGLTVGSDYANGIRVEACECSSGGLSGAFIRNPGAGWVLDTCIVEAGSAGAVTGVQQSVGSSSGLEVDGCWFGDLSVAGGYWLNLLGGGYAIKGSYFGGMAGQTAIHFGASTFGIDVKGNTFDGLAAAMDFGANCKWVDAVGNNYSSTPVVFTGTRPLSGFLDNAAGGVDVIAANLYGRNCLPTPNGAGQALSAIFASVGVPSNADGNDTDMCYNKVTGQWYNRQAGVWVAV